MRIDARLEPYRQLRGAYGWVWVLLVFFAFCSGIWLLRGGWTSHDVWLGLKSHHSLIPFRISGHSKKMPIATNALDISKKMKYRSAWSSSALLAGELSGEDDAEVHRMKTDWKRLLAFMASIYALILLDAIRVWRKR